MLASARKYAVIFRVSWQKELEYRFNFFLGRLRNILVMLLLYFVWTTLSRGHGRFAGYSEAELITYVFGMNFLRSVVFGAQSRQVASDINVGAFSSYLIMPINFFSRTFSSELAQRSLSTVTAVAEILLFTSILDVHLLYPRNALSLSLFALSVALAMVLYFLLSFLVSLLAFWSREALGPRFLFEWVLEFASGAYFPIDILSPVLYTTLAVLPFSSITYFPMQIYLGRLPDGVAGRVLVVQLAWIGLTALFVRLVWKRGLRKYTGEGI